MDPSNPSLTPEALYTSLVESLPLNIFQKDLQFRLVFGNRRFCAALGRTLEEIRRRTDFDLFPRELAEKYRSDDQRVLDTGATFEDVEEIVSADGSRHYVHVLKAPIRDAAGYFKDSRAAARLRGDAALQPLRDREDFRKLLQGLGPRDG